MLRAPFSLILVAAMCVPIHALATVDFCAVNDLTGECALVESGGLYDVYEPLGWRPCDCGERCPPIEEYCRQLGYEVRDYPSYRIEIILGLVLVSGLLVLVVVRKAVRAKP